MRRTHMAGELRPAHAGQRVTLAGWVHRSRDHGGVIFVDLRDRAGIVQVVFHPQTSEEAFRVAETLRAEDVVYVTGTVQMRPPEMVNPKLATGEVEVFAETVEVLNRSRTPPFVIRDEVAAGEELRLKYRYLDLRRPRMQRNLHLRHRTVKFIRDWLDARGFWEIETPILIKSTPEGARDFLVPSRLQPGKFYALPQSPQQLKQLLMVAGIDRYFQIARCFRDEDLRGDRQPEFTQLDMEMAFVDEEDVIGVNEALMVDLVRAVVPHKRIQQVPFPRLSYAEALERYGSDKPDLRFGLELVDLGHVWHQTDFRVFRAVLAEGGQVKGIRAPGLARYSRKQIDELEKLVRQWGAHGLAWVKVQEGGELQGSVARFLADGARAAFLEATQAEPGDLVLMVAGEGALVADVLGRLRLELGDRLGLRDPDVLAFAWIVDFPLFEWNEEEGRWDAMHHPFTSPKDEDLERLETDPGQVRAKAYDLVANGWELAGGSIRIHRRDVQQKVFELLNISPERAQERFGHMLEAFEYGAPPHGGIAWGLDRVVMVFADEPNIREVIAFPKTASGVDLMTGAPSEVDPEQLAELHIRVVLPEEEKATSEP